MATTKTKSTEGAAAKKPAAEKKSAAAKPAAKKPAAKASSGDKKPNALSVKVTPSKELAAIVGDKPLARSEVVSKTWDYIKKNKLQNPDDGREILADAELEKVFGKKKATMFEMNKFLNAHLS